MFKNIFAGSTKIIPINEPNMVRVSYNNERCYKCNKNDCLIPIKDNASSNVSFCKNCKISILLFEYITEEKYLKNIKTSLSGIQVVKFEEFIKYHI